MQRTRRGLRNHCAAGTAPRVREFRKHCWYFAARSEEFRARAFVPKVVCLNSRSGSLLVSDESLEARSEKFSARASASRAESLIHFSRMYVELQRYSLFTAIRSTWRSRTRGHLSVPLSGVSNAISFCAAGAGPVLAEARRSAVAIIGMEGSL